MNKSTSLQYLKGIGPKKIKLLERLDIMDIDGLLHHVPRNYEDRSTFCPLAQLKNEQTETIVAEVCGLEELKPRRGLTLLKVQLKDKTGSCVAVWFNQPYLKKQIKIGKELIITGKITRRNGINEINVKEFEQSSVDDSLSAGRIVPCYPSTDGLNQRFWRDIQHKILKQYLDEIPEIFSEEERLQYKLFSVKKAWEQIHFPSDITSLENARYRLAFEELYILQLSLAILRQEATGSKQGYAQINNELCKKLVSKLPFSLTNAQQRIIRELKRDMEATKPMQRLIQGDVGSGKTIIAAWALLRAVGSGYQGILMVPTEILARQHFESLNSLFEPLGVETILLTGSLPLKEKQDILGDIKNNKYNVIIGTHALFQDNVQFFNSSLVVIDEQHRFGVRQRAALESKGMNPDVLVMSATPIPRTLAMTLYGDLDISILDELPPGRKEVLTYCIKSQAKQKLYNLLNRQLKKGEQVYIVCPLVEESEKLDLKNAIDVYEEISKKLFGWKVGLVHGRMNSVEKESVMKSFTDGDIKILVSTTVIEVGVNVPLATVMVIEDADRFGLAQLHQLRGRVGRGTKQSYCILVTSNMNTLALKRLKLLTETNDGFKLAEEDLKARGAGEFFGLRQHGLPTFKIADLQKDEEILLEARNLAVKVLREDALLQKGKHENLKKCVYEYVEKMVKF